MIVKGQRGPHFLGERRERSGKHVRITHTWQGTELEVKGQNVSAYSGSSVNRIGDSPVWQLEAYKETSTTGEAITDTFELLGNTKQEPIRYNPILQSRLDANAIAFIEEGVNAIRQGRDDYDTVVAEINSSVADADAGKQLLDLLIYRLTSYLDFDPVFRWTRSATSGYDIPVFYDNAKKVYADTATMLQTEGIAGQSFGLPEKKWLKVMPAVHEQLSGVKEVVYEYWGADRWSTLLYAVAVV